MDVVLEKSQNSTGVPSLDPLLAKYLEDSIKQECAFFAFRYPGQRIAMAVHRPQAGHSYEFAPFHGSSSISIHNVSFTPLSELLERDCLPKATIPSKPSSQEFFSMGREKFQEMVAFAKSCINNGEISKVVLSRIKKTNLKIDPLNAFFNLEAQFPSAFVYIFYHPSAGLWVGASPEKLLEKKGVNSYYIHSLAGTKHVAERWTEKELIEQEMVTEDILTKLKSIGISDLNLEGPFDLEYGSIKHLKTRISFQSPIGPKSILLNIHPTPAVCGIPTERARRLINQLEGYDRSFYTGYLGLKTPEDNIETYFVNLRCMQFKGDNCYIYTGAGIVAESIPENEWDEVELKAQTLLNCIQNNA